VVHTGAESAERDRPARRPDEQWRLAQVEGGGGRPLRAKW
jgi:hypothetical protein